MDETLKIQCEEYVRSRQTRLADKTIAEFLKLHHRSMESRFQAGEWYRRMGDYAKAYAIVAPKEFSFKKANEDPLVRRQYLRTAHFLNSLGASQSALRIAQLLKNVETYEDNRILGNIFLTNGEAKKALHYFLHMEKMDSDPLTYHSRMGRIATCDALSMLGENKKALQRLSLIRALPEENLLHGILMQARGEYLSKAGHWKKARLVLDEAAPYFPKGEQGYDRLVLLMWQAITHAHLGEREQAKKLFKTLLKKQEKRRSRPEVWLSYYRWMNEFNFLTQEEKELLWAYPGIAEMTAKDYGRPLELTIGPKNPGIWLSSLRNEYRIDGRLHGVMPKQLELLEMLVRSGAIGLGVYQACSLLWPNEIGSFALLEDRLQKLQRRLRSGLKIEVYTEDKVIRLGKQHFGEIAVEVLAQDQKPSIFMQYEQATWQNVRDFYQLGKTQSFKLIKTWIEQNRAVKTGYGRKTLFKPL